ncbi:LLM class flavin-dependent oxidoreductase [Microbacterium hominis]|uniref:LLM class flavin-dependent oxidoreductase n=1 Tax=Microbacterium hominis TaxID=162426 RepID=A0A7D4Q7F6_9MICO|nr:LLM class flavin-dependent oxidoreductase [Microbacterium hominis]QKJ18979.1 LLM class flavin-dependent oxidoreductase [Microbacterium hominis]
MSQTSAKVSIGVAAGIGPARIARLAPRIEAAGFHGLWVNDTPGHDALAALAAAGRATTGLTLATGVLPVDRRPAADIVDRVVELGLDTCLDRVVLGLGSGQLRTGAVDAVARATAELRVALPGARIVVGALGPRMRRRGAAASNGLLLSWLTPDLARAQADEAHAIAPAAHVALYVRTTMDAAARAHLHDEAARYAAFPAYAANFARLGIEVGETVIEAEEAGARIAAYRAAVDEVVLRIVTASDDADADDAFVAAAAAHAD